ncbi:hypothetical protein V2J09_020298, partial [Rumex salicifolius]
KTKGEERTYDLSVSPLPSPKNYRGPTLSQASAREHSSAEQCPFISPSLLHFNHSNLSLSLWPRKRKMMGIRRRFACCARDREISIDFDEHQPDKIITYDGLESCILNSNCYENENGESSKDECAVESVDDEVTSCSSSSAFENNVSSWTAKDDQESQTWNAVESPQHLYSKEKPTYVIQISDVDAMKEKFAKLLLGEDVSGGKKAKSPALALSNAITNLAASVFGELWKLEPLQEDKKNKWRKEMDWLLSPTNYMIELVPAKQSGVNGRVFEIMTPKARADIHMNLPALQKLDSMLIDTLDSMVKTEFWYSEGSSHGEDKEESMRQSRRWWLPYPRVPFRGLSEYARKKLISQGNVVHQVFKAAKSINHSILAELPSGRAILGEQIYSIVAKESSSAIEMAESLKLKSEHEALNTINKLEAAQLVWKDRVAEEENGKSPSRKPWSFKDPESKLDKIESLLFRLQILLQQLRMRYPYLPHTFLDVTKLKYGTDIGHAIMEAYSRVLANLAYNMLLRIGDILQEDHSSNPTSPVPMTCFPGLLSPKWCSPSPNQRARRSLVDQMSRADGYFSDSNPSIRSSDLDISSSEARTSSVMATPSASRVWCTGNGSEPYSHGSPCNSP